MLDFLEIQLFRGNRRHEVTGKFAKVDPNLFGIVMTVDGKMYTAGDINPYAPESAPPKTN
jgi:hypothetical protein